jgi:hypothetical protein
LRFYARSNYREEITRELGAPGVFDKQFFGEAFSLDTYGASSRMSPSIAASS